MVDLLAVGVEVEFGLGFGVLGGDFAGVGTFDPAKRAMR